MGRDSQIERISSVWRGEPNGASKNPDWTIWRGKVSQKENTFPYAQTVLNSSWPIALSAKGKWDLKS
jgi:hypothetical protein